MTAPCRDVLVLLREVRDPRPPLRLEGNGATVRETGLRRLLNPADLSALDAALRLRLPGAGRVIALAIGDERLDDALRLALSMGATRAVRVWDDALREGDAVADARVLRRVLEVTRPALLVTGDRLLDRGDDPAAALAAATYGIPCAGAVLSCVVRGEGVELLRRAERGGRQRVAAPLPCAILFDEAAAEPRYPDLPEVLAAMEAELEVWGLAELGLPAWELGFDGAALRTAGLAFPRNDPLRVATPDPTAPGHERVRALFSGGIRPRGGKMRFGGADEAAQRLHEILAEEALVPGRRA